MSHLPRSMACLLFTLALFAPTGCKNKSQANKTLDITADQRRADKDSTAEIRFSKNDVVEVKDDEISFPTDVADVPEKPQDVTSDKVAKDSDSDTWTPTACASHEDCGGMGLCVEISPGTSEYVCAPHCVEECPLDWLCKSLYVDGPDPVSLCFPPTEIICAVCKNDKECLFGGSLCVKGSGSLGFCGKFCHPTEAPGCPAGFFCEMAKGKNGESIGYQCLPPEGHCCVAGNLKDCDDGNPCTADTCDPSLGCQYKNIDGPCEGPGECTEYKCLNGGCVGFPVTLDTTPDGIDDDCDGLTDEDWAYGLKVPVHSFISTEKKSTSGSYSVEGTLSSPPVTGVSTGGDFKVTPGMSKVKEEKTD